MTVKREHSFDYHQPSSTIMHGLIGAFSTYSRLSLIWPHLRMPTRNCSRTLRRHVSQSERSTVICQSSQQFSTWWGGRKAIFLHLFNSQVNVKKGVGLSNSHERRQSTNDPDCGSRSSVNKVWSRFDIVYIIDSDLSCWFLLMNTIRWTDKEARERWRAVVSRIAFAIFKWRWSSQELPP